MWHGLIHFIEGDVPTLLGLFDQRFDSRINAIDDWFFRTRLFGLLVVCFCCRGVCHGAHYFILG